MDGPPFLYHTEVNMNVHTRTVTSQFGNDEAETEIEVVTFPENVEPAKVSFSWGETRQVRKYEPIKYRVSVTIPCYREEIDAALDEAERIVDFRIASLQDQVDCL